MAENFETKARACCTREHDRLVEYLKKCDINYNDAEDRHRCYRLSARRSGRRAKKCSTAI